MGMFEKAEQEYQDVMEKKRIVENDKRKIEMVMHELDEKKNQALKTTWTKVCVCVCARESECVCARARQEDMGWLRLVSSLKIQVSFAEYRLFYRALFKKRPII